MSTGRRLLSTYFLTPIKLDGSLRFILNFKKWNEFIELEHFVIEDILTAINILKHKDYTGVK